MGEAERVEKTKRELEIYIFGGNQEVVRVICSILNIRKIESVANTYKKTDFLKIKDLNYFDTDFVEKHIKSIAQEEFYLDKNVDKYFTSNKLPFGNENQPSHWNSNNDILAKLMIQYSRFKDDEKETLLKLVNDFKIETYFTELMFDFFNYKTDVQYKLLDFIREIKNQEIDIQFRLKILSDVLKKINLSLIKNNEVINSRAYKYKKDISKKINETIIFIKSQIEKELEFYIKTINSNDFLGFIEEIEPREFLIGKLIENRLCLDKFNKLEKKLISIDLLSNEHNRWLGTAKGFIEFYQLCEEAKIFNSIYIPNSKGVKILRKMYKFEEGKSIDKRCKRKNYNYSAKITYYSFLQYL